MSNFHCVITTPNLFRLVCVSRKLRTCYPLRNAKRSSLRGRHRALSHSNTLCYLYRVGISEKMSMLKPLRKLIKCVILDLDGTLLNTDGIVGNVLKVILTKYGKQWDGREAHKIVGKTPFESAAAIVQDYGLPCSTTEFISEISPLFSNQWRNIKALPGANRLIKHLKSHGVPMALASNSPRESIEAKISYHDG